MKLSTLQPRLKPTTAQTPKKNWGQGRGGRAWRRLRDEILARDSYTCQCCGRVGGRLELDHIVNVAQGGTNDKSNLQILCHSCHKTKTQSESRAGGVQQFLS
ncbi:HNH endonuclease [Moraxella bovis]|uniref:HNH endonuclease n=1 Tax=Moraxella bovis TaxID=476 RepID=A0AAQ2Q6J5_MORBO|nr:HNH endonuclease [Moraxella bovis]AWY20093.1 HNH endonuclease [Moraxella bovis]UYZ67615.1 HNH endonuclease [Moraxella bovis]UYZ74760.1 HNH endonuclease [Moraxella bovis]UYZ79312.1 HNH endonuclease [Moraxella bovis]UYZ80109.1 HNH endonuclease [Moraxella bovis]